MPRSLTPQRASGALAQTGTSPAAPQLQGFWSLLKYPCDRKTTLFLHNEEGFPFILG